MEEKALTVSQLSNYIKRIFDAEELLFNIKVVGEISGLSIVRNIAYFTLKDDGAILSCVCFDALEFDFKNGDNVIVTGTPRYYVKGGKLNFNVSKISKSGQGELYQKFLELKNTLQKLGYFDEEHKIDMPKNIKRVGVVTSREGAVIQDIINVRTRRNPFIDIVLYPVKVQGINAEYEIAKGIEFFNSYNVDLIIVARGGGSFEDLQPFNTRVVADAVYNSQKFVLSAVGHETDFTICDFCSDLRAPTPSVASELVCQNVKEQFDLIKKDVLKIQSCIKTIFIDKQSQFVSLTSSMINHYSNFNDKLRLKINDYNVKMVYNIKSLYTAKYNNFDKLSLKLDKLNPNSILKLGYACIKNKEKIINSVKQVTKGSTIDIVLQDGNIIADVKDIKEN